MQKVHLCSVDDLSDGEVKSFTAGREKIALVRIGGQFYAVGDTCSHANYSLSEGEVYTEEHSIECWKHGSTFSLATGMAKNLPATRPVPVYPVEVDGSDVSVVLP